MSVFTQSILCSSSQHSDRHPPIAQEPQINLCSSWGGTLAISLDYSGKRCSTTCHSWPGYCCTNCFRKWQVAGCKAGCSPAQTFSSIRKRIRGIWLFCCQWVMMQPCHKPRCDSTFLQLFWWEFQCPKHLLLGIGAMVHAQPFKAAILVRLGFRLLSKRILVPDNIYIYILQKCLSTFYEGINSNNLWFSLIQYKSLKLSIMAFYAWEQDLWRLTW